MIALPNAVPLDAQHVGALLSWLVRPAGAPPFGLPDDTVRVALWAGERLFLEEPPLQLDAHKVRAFEGIVREQFGRSPASDVVYDCPHPLHEFTRYLMQTGRYLLHGSGLRLDVLEPQQQGDWAGRPMRVVFASGDGIWPMFFALLKRANLRGSIRNACVVVRVSPEESRRFYFFSVNEETLAAGAWGQGTLHVLPRESFAPTGAEPVRFDEWASEREVPVLARIPVSPDDFPFLRHVTGHREEEPIVETWARYKERQRLS